MSMIPTWFFVQTNIKILILFEITGLKIITKVVYKKKNLINVLVDEHVVKTLSGVEQTELLIIQMK